MMADIQQTSDTGVPQAQTEAIARRLLGDDLVNRYGDVIGARPSTAVDSLRDFTLGFTHGQNKVDDLHLKVQKQYQDAYTKQQRAAVAAKTGDIKQAKAILDAIKTVQGLPPGHRTAILKETLEGAGIPYSAAALKMFADSDLLSQLPMDDLQKAVDDGTLSTSEISGVMGSGLNAAKFISEAARRKREDQQTQGLILNAERTKIETKRDQLAFDEARKTRGLDILKKRLTVGGLELGNKLKQKALDKAGKGLTGIPEIDAELAGTPLPAGAAPTVQTPGGTGSTNTAQNALAAAKARLGIVDPMATPVPAGPVTPAPGAPAGESTPVVPGSSPGTGE
jgi:hypothetical protein